MPFVRTIPSNSIKMRPYLFVTLAALFGANALPNLSTRYNDDPVVVDLGDAGVYKAGYAYNNTVKYWRGGQSSRLRLSS